MRPGIAYFSLFMTPIFLEIVLDIQSMWFFHVKHSSMSTPRNLVKVSFNVILKSWCVLVDVILGVPKIIKLVLLAFTDNLFALNCRLTSGSVRFWLVSVVLNNDNFPWPDRTTNWAAVAFFEVAPNVACFD